MLLAFATYCFGHKLDALFEALKAFAAVMILWAMWHFVCLLWRIRIITGLHVGDPRIEVSFIDERKEVIPTQHSAALELHNKGNSHALWVRIEPLRLKKRVLYFPDISESIAPTDYRRFHAEVGDKWGYDSRHGACQRV